MAAEARLAEGAQLAVVPAPVRAPGLPPRPRGGAAGVSQPRNRPGGFRAMEAATGRGKQWNTATNK